MDETCKSATASSFLVHLHNYDNSAAWREFESRYWPILVAFGRRLGLSPTDAADAAQDTLTRFLKSYAEKKYDRNKGRLRWWIMGIARNCIADLKRKKASRHESCARSDDLNISDQAQLDSIWDTECRRTILSQALERLWRCSNIQPRTIEAFRLIVLNHQPAESVASELGMTTSAVHVSKHRCLARLREIVGELSSAYDADNLVPTDHEISQKRSVTTS